MTVIFPTQSWGNYTLATDLAEQWPTLPDCLADLQQMASLYEHIRTTIWGYAVADTCKYQTDGERIEEAKFLLSWTAH